VIFKLAGDINCFSSFKVLDALNISVSETLLEKHLGMSFVHPMKVIVSDKQKLSIAEKQMVEKALAIMEDHGTDTIYSLYLLPENECSPKDYKTIVNLIQKGVFQPSQ